MNDGELKRHWAAEAAALQASKPKAREPAPEDHRALAIGRAMLGIAGFLIACFGMIATKNPHLYVHGYVMVVVGMMMFGFSMFFRRRITFWRGFVANSIALAAILGSGGPGTLLGLFAVMIPALLWRHKD